jgi:Secretion system C-terminal sorting domain
VAPQGSPLNFNPSDSLFSMTIVPSKSGNVSQFISLSDSLLSSEAVKFTFETSKIDLTFSFLQRTSTTDEKLKASDVDLFPNPNNGDFLTITSPYIKNSIVKISDLNGRVLSENKLEDNETQQLKLPQDMPNGLYLVEISTPKGRVIKKLIVAN